MTNDHGCVLFVVITITYHVFVCNKSNKGATCGDLGSHPIFSGVRITRSLVFCVCLVDRFLPFCPFSSGPCVVCSSIYGF